MEIWIYWLIAAMVLIIIELFTQWISAFCFAVGSVVALLFCLADASVPLQIIALGASALIAFILCGKKLIVLNRHLSHEKHSASNIEAIHGRIGTVVEAIPAGGLGRIKIDGDNWQARNNDKEAAIAIGSTVRVLNNDSIIMIVTPVKL
jgi:membrane protein implicated in regulation of membrane protease activity